MAINVKMGVDLGSFTSGIKEGQSILKGLNAEMKATEAEFKATGNAEKKLEQQTKTLNSQLQVQKGIADQAQKALKAMDEAGIKPTDQAYQKMYATMMNAQAGMNEAQASLNALGTSAQTAATGADKLTDSVNGIGKKISLDQVISGIGTITNGLEKAAQKAVQLGQTIMNEVVNAAKWADDTATMAQMYEIPLDRYMRMQQLVQGGMDTSVESMLSSMDRLKRGVGNETKNTMETLTQLGLVTTRTIDTQFGLVEETGLKTKDATKLFWEAGQAMMKMGDDFDKEAAATALFGKSWKELIPLFSTYKTAEEYEAALSGVNVNSEETVTNLAELNDKLGALEANFDTLKREIIGQLAPGLETAADALNKVLTSVLDYMNTPEGQEMLSGLSDAVSSLFEDLGNIDPQSVVESFTSVFNGLVDGLKWIHENHGLVIGALQAIVAGWAALNITGGILEIVKIVNGLQTLSASSAAAAGTAAGSSWAGAFASAAMKAAPFLAFLYTMLNPSGSAGNEADLAFNNGHVTQASLDFWNNNPDQWSERLLAAGNRYGSIADLMANKDAMNILLNPTIDDEEMFRQLDELGVPVTVEPTVPEDTAAALSEQIGTVVVNGVVNWVDSSGNVIGMDMGLVEGPIMQKYRRPKANGIWSVPYDGYLATLHKGERVVPAREVASRNYSSNLYVESMYMNNGTDAAGLAAAMAAAQRRQMSGYGS